MVSSPKNTMAYVSVLLYTLTILIPNSRQESQVDVICDNDNKIYVIPNDCPGDIAMVTFWNREPFDVFVDVVNIDTSKAFLNNSQIRAGDVVVVSFPGNYFDEDTTFGVSVYDPNGSMVKQQRVYLLLQQELVGVKAVIKNTQSNPPYYFPSGSNITINAWVSYGINVTFEFTFSMGESEDGVVTYQKKNFSNVDTTKSVSLDHDVGTQPGLYYLNVVALSSSEESLSVPSIEFYVKISIPDMKLSQSSYEVLVSGDVDVIFETKEKVDSFPSHNPVCNISWNHSPTDLVACVFAANILHQLPSHVECRARLSTDTLSPGEHRFTIQCPDTLPRQYEVGRVNVISRVSFADVNLVKSVVPFNKTTDKGHVGLTYSDSRYEGPLPPNSFVLVDVDFGESLSNPSYRIEQDKHLYVDYDYSNKGEFEISVNISDGFFAMERKYKVKIGILDFVAKDEVQSVSENEEVTFFITQFTNNELQVQITYSQFDTTLILIEATSTNHSVRKAYPSAGNYAPFVAATYDDVTEEVVYELTVSPLPVNENITTDDLFETAYRNPTTPLPATLAGIPTISARSPVDDKQTYTLSFLWKLSKNTKTAPEYNWGLVSIDQPGAINLVVKSFISEIGLYKIELDISIAELNITVGDYMYMDVQQESIVAIVKGGALQQVAVRQPISLDGSLSYDPTVSESQDNDFNDGLTFSWRCYELNTDDQITKYTVSFHHDVNYRQYPPCTISQTPPEAKISVDANSYSINQWILFEMIVSKTSRTAMATQAIHFVGQQQPTLQVICQWNCGPKLLTEDRTVLRPEIICPTCTQEQMATVTYQWSLYKLDLVTGDKTLIPTVDWSPKIESAENSPMFDSQGGWWNEAAGYKVAVQAAIPSLPSTSGEMNLYTNLPPYGGRCDVTPKEGIAGETYFTFTATGWMDEGSRPNRDPRLDLMPVLSYTYQQEATLQTPFVYSGGEMSTPPKKLVACDTPTGKCKVVATILDPYKGVARCTMEVKVTELLDLDSKPVTEQLSAANDVIESLEKQMNKSIEKQDPVKIAQDAATYSTILESMSDTIETDEQFTNVSVKTLDSSNGLSGLVNFETADDPVKDALAKASNKFITDTNGALNKAIERNDVRNPDQVEMFSKSLTTSLQSAEKFATGSSVREATDSAESLSQILSNQSLTSRVVHGIDSAFNSMSDLMNSIVHSMDINTASLDPTPEQLGANTGLNQREINYAADLLAKRRRYKLESRIVEAPNVVQLTRKTWSNMFKVTKDLQNSHGKFEISKGNYKMNLKKTDRKQILKESQTLGGQSDPVIDFSVKDVEIDDDYQNLHFQVVKTKNIFSHGANSKYITSDVIIASIETHDSKVNMVTPTIRHQVEDCQTNEKVEMVRPEFINDDAAHLFYHQFDYNNPHGRVCIKIRPTNNAVFYRLYAKMGSEPNDLNYDYRATVSSSQVVVCSEVCIPKGKLKGTGTGYIGLRPFLDTSKLSGRTKRSVDSGSSTDPLVSPYGFALTVTACYSWDDKVVDWIASRCEIQRSGGQLTCVCGSGRELVSAVSFQFAPNRIHFGTVFSKFDIENQAAVIGVLLGMYFLFGLLAVWAHYMDRKSIVKWGVFPLKDNYAEDEYFYLITVHTGLRKGAGTTSNIGFSLLGDFGETGARELTDGVREGMSTGSVVHLVMAVPECLGSLQYLRVWHDNSGVGNDGAWYLNKVVVIDLHNGESFHFHNHEWLSPEHDTLDKVINASTEEELKAFQSTFINSATNQITDDHMWLSVFIRPDRSRFNRLERVGCCLSFLLLSMITSAMFYQGTEGIDRQQPTPDFSIGPFRFVWQQLYFSLLAAAITSVPIFLIVVIFRRARFHMEEKLARSTCCCRKRRTNDDKGVEVCYEKQTTNVRMRLSFTNSTYDSLPEDRDDDLQQKSVERKDDNNDDENDDDDDGVDKASDDIEIISIEDDKKVVDKEEDIAKDDDDVFDKNVKNRDREGMSNTSFTKCCAKTPWMTKLESQIEELNKILLIRPVGRESLDGSWPYLLRFVAWGLIFVSVLVCSFFIILYSMEWGKDVSEEWLSTFFLTFLQSLLVVDPAKVILISFLFSIFLQKDKFVGVREINMAVVSEVNGEYGIKEKPNPPRKIISYHSALTPEVIQEAILKRKVSMLVRKTLMELAIHGILMLLVCSFCYSTRTSLDYRMYQTVHGSLISSKYTGFQYVNTTKMYYDWLEDVVTPWLFPERNYKGESIVSEDRQYTADWSLYRLGAPRLRQLRMSSSDECSSTKIKSLPCVDSYDINDEMVTEFCFGWSRPLPCPSIDQLRLTAGAWYFQSAFEIWGIPISGQYSTYGGGGYIANLDINAVVAKTILKEAKNSFWIDRHTRAVFLEFTLYNANVNHFINVVLLAEFLPQGGVITYHTIHPFAPYPQHGTLGQFIVICEIVALILTAIGFVYIVYEFRTHQKSAFRNFWFMVDVLVFIVDMLAITMYSLRSVALKSALEKMRADPTKYVNFVRVVVWDMGMFVCLGFLIALVSFRLLKLAGYSKKTMRVYEVLRLSVGVLPSFMLSIWLIISSFAVTGMLLFSATSKYYKTYLDSLYVLFLGVLGKTGFKNTGLPPAGVYMTIFYIVLFGCIVNIFLANWFIAILLDILTVNAQRDCPAVRSDNAKVFQLLWESLVYLFCKKNNYNPVETLRKNHELNATKSSQPKKVGPDPIIQFYNWLQRLNLAQRYNDTRPAFYVEFYDKYTGKDKANFKNMEEQHDTNTNKKHKRKIKPDTNQPSMELNLNQNKTDDLETPENDSRQSSCETLTDPLSDSLT